MKPAVSLPRASTLVAFQAAMDYVAARPLLLLATILLLALPLRLLHLGESLWLDELWSIRIILDGSDPIRLLVRDIHPPLYSLFLFAWIGLFGDAELSIRLPSLIFALLSIVLAWSIASLCLGRRTAVLACLLLALSPVHVMYAQEARAYAALQCLLLATLLAYLKLCACPTSQSWTLVYACSLLAAALTSFLIGAYLFAFSALTLVDERAPRRRLLAINLLVAVPFVSWVLVTQWFSADMLHDAASYLRPFTPYEAWMLFFNWLPLGNAVWSIWPYAGAAALLDQPALLVTQVFLAALFVRGLLLVGREALHPRPLIAALFVLPLCLLAVSLTPLQRIYIERSVFVALPLYFMVLARGAIGFQRPAVAPAMVAALLGLSVASLVSFVAREDEWTVYKPRPDWRSATAYFERELREHSRAYPVFTASLADELLYYARRYDHPDRLHPTVYRHSGELMTQTWLDLRYLGEQTNPCAISLDEGADEFYLLHNRHWSADFPAALDRALAHGGCHLADKQTHRSLEIYRFTVRRARGHPAPAGRQFTTADPPGSGASQELLGARRGA